MATMFLCRFPVVGQQWQVLKWLHYILEDCFYRPYYPLCYGRGKSFSIKGALVAGVGSLLCCCDSDMAISNLLLWLCVAVCCGPPGGLKYSESLDFMTDLQ